MGTTKWLGVCAVALAAATAQAQEKTKAYIAPYAGYTHMRLDAGTVFNEADTARFDALTFGASFGFQMPIGLLVEIGRSHAIHADVFDDQGDFELTENYGAVGWRIPFADGWHFTPKVGRAGWELSSNHRILLDDAGERHYELNGWDNFWEVSLTRQIKQSILLGVNFKDVDQDFGHARSGTFTASFAF